MRGRIIKRAGARGMVGVLLGLWLMVMVGPGVGAQHTHVQISYVRGEWDLHIFDFDAGRFDPGTFLVEVGQAARSVVPMDPRYEAFMGRGGSPVWILPQNEREGVMNLGVGSSQISSGVFEGDQLRLELRRLEGPGSFALFTSTPFGDPVWHMATLDGVDPAKDFLNVPAISGHIHLNWAFTSPGNYRVGLAATGRLMSTGQKSESPMIDFHFLVKEVSAPRLDVLRLVGDDAVAVGLECEVGSVCRLEGTSDWKS